MASVQSDAESRSRTLSMNTITVYIDTEKRQSHSQSNSGYRAVERLMKKINQNPDHYEHQKWILIGMLWNQYLRYIVLFVSIILVLLALFCGFYPDDITPIWPQRIWLYLSIGVLLLIGIMVIAILLVIHFIEHCDRKRWAAHELQRIHQAIKDVNIMEFADERKATLATKKNWTFYADADDGNDRNNINNLHFVTLNAPILSPRERKGDVIKMKIQIWLDDKEKLLDGVREESISDADQEQALTQTLIA